MGKWYENAIENDVKSRDDYQLFWSYPHLLRTVRGDFDYHVYEKEKLIAKQFLLLQHIKKLDCINLFIFVIAIFSFPSLLLLNIIYIFYRNKKKKELEIKFDPDTYLNTVTKTFEELSQTNIMHVIRPNSEVRWGSNILKNIIKINVPYIELDCYDMFFIENGILFSNKNTIFILPYCDMDFTILETTAEMIKPPTNAEIISTTWEHVNKNGTPNKRYKDNNEINIVKTWVISIKSKDDNICFEFALFNKECAYKIYETINNLIERNK